MDLCPLCEPDVGPVIHKSRYWLLVLNRNQNLLGKCFLLLRRHTESVTDLRMDEWNELHALLATTTEMLQRACQPDRFNYVFLHNEDIHVHLHVIPRYASPRRFAGSDFDDRGWPGHYDTQQGTRTLPENEREELEGMMRSSIEALEDDRHG